MRENSQNNPRGHGQTDDQIVESYQQLATAWIAGFGESQRRATEDRITAFSRGLEADLKADRNPRA